VVAVSLMHRREDPIVTTSDLIGWFSHDLTHAITSISCPAYLIVGSDDFWLDLDQVRWTGSQIQGCRTVVLDGIGHYPMEELENFPKLAEQWLNDLAQQRRELESNSTTPYGS